MKLSTYKGVPLKVLPIVEPVVKELGYKLWDVEFYKEGSEQILCVTLDSEKGIDIEDCEKVSRALDAPLDEADPIACEYSLMVSSPGVERDLKRKEHIEEFIGEEVKATLYSANKEGIFSGMKTIRATLSGLNGEENAIVFTLGEKSESIPLEKIANLKTVYDF